MIFIGKLQFKPFQRVKPDKTFVKASKGLKPVPPRTDWVLIPTELPLTSGGEAESNVGREANLSGFFVPRKI